MILTVLDMVTAQLREIGVLDPNETPDDTMITNAIQANNIMLDSWSAKRLMVRAMTQENFPLVPGQASYTIGIGGNFNTSKPMSIIGAFLRDNVGVDSPVNIFTQDQYEARDDKSIVAGRPEALYFDPGYAQQLVNTGTIWVYYIPDATVPYQLYITSQKYLTELVNPFDIISIEPAYYRAIKWNGVIEQYYGYRSHKIPIPMDIKKAARESMSTVMTMNSTQMLVGLDLPGVKNGVFNILVGDEVGS